MEHVVVVRGRLRGQRIDLDEPLDELEGEVEVTVRVLPTAHPTVADMLALLGTLKAGTRTKEDIDCQIAAERTGWDRD